MKATLVDKLVPLTLHIKQKLEIYTYVPNFWQYISVQSER